MKKCEGSAVELGDAVSQTVGAKNIDETLCATVTLQLFIGGCTVTILGGWTIPPLLGLKGTVARDCRPLVFSIIDPIWAPDSHPKIFSNLVSNSGRYSDLYVYQRCRIQR